MKIRTVVISLVVTAGLAGGIAYGVRYAMQAGKKPVDVVPVATVNYGFWGDTNTMSGNIISRDTQTVQLNSDYKLVKVYVETGDTVKRGDPLLEYDMTLTELQREMENLTKQSLEIDLASQQKALEKLQNTTPTASLEVNDGVMTASDELLLEEDPAAGGQGSGGAPAGTGNGGNQGGGNGPALISDGGGDTSGDLILDEAPSVSPGAPAGEIIIEDNSQSGSQAGTAGESETATGDTAETEPEIPEQTESETSGAEQTESESDSVLEDPETEPETQTEDSLLTDDSETPEGDEMTELDQETVIKAVNAFLTRVSQLSSQELDSLIASDISEALRIYREQLSVVREQELEGLDVLGERRVVRSYSLNPSVASIVGESTAQVLTQAYERACFYQFVYCMEQLKPGNVTVEQPEETPEEPAEGETEEAQDTIQEETSDPQNLSANDLDDDTIRAMEELIRNAVDAFYDLPQTVWTNPEYAEILVPYRDELAAFVARLNRLYVLEETEPATEAESEMYDDFGDYGDFGDFGDFGDTGETYTAEELKLAIEEQKRDIEETQLQIRESDLRLKQYDRTLDSQIVRSTMDGIVKSAGTVEDSVVDEDFIVITGEAGMYVQGSLNEMRLDSVGVGDQVTGTSYDSGLSFTATITEISMYPTESNDYYYSYGGDNTNASYYPFLAYIEDAEGLTEGYVDLQLVDNSPTTGIYLENYFIRTENDGRSYVYIQGEDGLLKKQYVQTGQVIYSSATEIKTGLTMEDKVAFPYGEDVKEGAATREVDSLFYDSYYVG